jgi:hypothetical protein
VDFSQPNCGPLLSRNVAVSNYFSQLIVLHFFECICGANRADIVRCSNHDLGAASLSTLAEMQARTHPILQMLLHFEKHFSGRRRVKKRSAACKDLVWSLGRRYPMKPKGRHPCGSEYEGSPSKMC